MPNAVGYRPQNIMFRAQETALVQLAAKELGMTTHAFMRSTVPKKATEVLEKRDTESPNSDKDN